MIEKYAEAMAAPGESPLESGGRLAKQDREAASTDRQAGARGAIADPSQGGIGERSRLERGRRPYSALSGAPCLIR